MLTQGFLLFLQIIGYAFHAIFEAINDHYMEPAGQKDLFEQFDLIAGSSAGGIVGLVISSLVSSNGKHKDM